MINNQQPADTSAPARMTFGQFLKSYLGQTLSVLKHPKHLLPTLVLGVIWIVLGVMAAKAPLIMPLKVVSFLTFAQGGLYGGVVGAIGGIVGKIIIAGFLNAMIVPLFEKKAPFSGVGGGFKALFGSLSFDGIRAVAPLLYGIGAALLLYSVMNINQSGHNAMVGIVSLVMLLKVLGNKGGFAWDFIQSMANSMWGIKAPSIATITRTLTGLTLGFTLAVGLSVGGLRWCSWMSLVFLALAIVCHLLGRKKQPAAVAA